MLELFNVSEVVPIKKNSLEGNEKACENSLFEICIGFGDYTLFLNLNL